MAKGSLKLNMKRDDARTLMMKMDARLTYAGRERHAGFKLEGERQLKHIQITHQLINAELNRAKKDVQRRFDFYQTLKEQNKERREKRDLAWCEEEEKDWDRQTRAARRRRMLPNLKFHHKNHKAEAVGSIRRDVKGEYTHKMAHETNLNRSLIALSDSYSKHKSLTQRNQAKLEQITEDRDPVDMPAKTENTTLPTPQHEIQNPKYGMPLLKTRFPALQLSKAGESSTQKDRSLEMRAGKVGDTPPNDKRISRPVAGPPASLGQRFYMNTSTDREQHDAGTGPLQKDLPVLPSINRARRKGVYAKALTDPARVGGAFAPTGRPLPSLDHPRPSTQTKKPRPGPSVTLGPQTIPLRFYGSEENPFLKESDGPPSAVYRPKDLINSDKDDEMYEWLGFESREEFEKLRAAGLLLEAEREEGSDTSEILEDGTRVARMDGQETPENTE
ncbi:uncharacterized protein LOC119741868 [Patiria miniata]|uniref:Uncharacterized protein n=1 Tax=Patiria miniata TaxID=46514 RepID=A0A914BBW0_PATMI|nr:uncharacterized protein LOC119741868 [Patiria miniata]